MTWVCKNCNSDNDDSLTACELCGCTEKFVVENRKSVLTREKALALDIVSGALIVPSEYNVIGERAFEGNKNIKTVVLHDEVLSILMQAFKDCVNLENVVCEGTLDSIGPEAFRNCRALKAKPTAKTVDESAFKTDAFSSSEEPAPTRPITPTRPTTPTRPSTTTSTTDTTRRTTAPTRPTTTITTDVADETLSEEERARLKEYRNKIVCKVFAVIVPIIAFIAGQLYQYIFYFKNGYIRPLSLFFDSVPPVVLYVSSACCFVSAIHVIIRCWKLADDKELEISTFYFISSTVFFGVSPTIAGYVGIFATSAISLLCVTYNEEKVPLLLTFLSCAVGLTCMWLGYVKSDYILCFTEFTYLIDADPFRVKIYLGVATGASIIASIATTAGMAWISDKKSGYLFLMMFCEAMALAPALAIPGLLICAIIFVVISRKGGDVAETVGTIALSMVIMLTCLGMEIYCGVGKPKTETLLNYETVRIYSFEESRQYLNEEIVALDISNVADSVGTTIVTGENCKTLVIKSDYDKQYSLTIKTAAEKVILCDVNITHGGLVLSSENVEIKVYGRNNIWGETGKSGLTGKDGEAGKAAISGKNVTFTGKGRIALTAGNGGTGGMGEKGSNGSIGQSGGKGGTGGKGGNSGYAIDCEKVSAHDFTGKITLRKGYAGSGGDGGPGGDGGLFALSGSKGDKGEKGEVVDYCSGDIEIDEKRVKRA